MVTRAGCSLVAALVCLSTSPARAQKEEGLIDKAPSHFAKLDDLKVHYKSLGKGTTALVLVHGWSCDISFWKEQIPALDGKIRIVAIDLPGHGKSDRPKIEYTMDLFAKAVDAVLADAKVEDAILAGHSMGTPVVRQYYRLHPLKTKALIAVDGPLRSFTNDPKKIDAFMAMFKEEGFKETVGKFVDSMFKPDASAEIKAYVKSKMQAATPQVAISAMKNMFDAKIWKEDKIEVPVLCLLAKSPYWTEDYEKFVRRLAPKVDYRIMEGVGHFLMMEEPRTFNRHLLEFLEKQGFVKY
jgi:pimeloyl-ACP methyl ester carboxylesterase